MGCFLVGWWGASSAVWTGVEGGGDLDLEEGLEVREASFAERRDLAEVGLLLWEPIRVSTGMVVSLWLFVCSDVVVQREVWWCLDDGDDGEDEDEEKEREESKEERVG